MGTTGTSVAEPRCGLLSRSLRVRILRAPSESAGFRVVQHGMPCATMTDRRVTGAHRRGEAAGPRFDDELVLLHQVLQQRQNGSSIPLKEGDVFELFACEQVLRIVIFPLRRCPGRRREGNDLGHRRCGKRTMYPA